MYTTFFKVNPILTPSMSGTAPPRSDYAINLHPDITTLSKFGQNKQFLFTSFSPNTFQNNLIILIIIQVLPSLIWLSNMVGYLLQFCMKTMNL